jgi:two-component sensor histidine kinase
LDFNVADPAEAQIRIYSAKLHFSSLRSSAIYRGARLSARESEMQQCGDHAGEDNDPPKQGCGRAGPVETSSTEIGSQDIALLFEEANHRIRNFLAMVEAAIEQTRSTTLDGYRVSLMARISGLRGIAEMVALPDSGNLDIAELLEATMRAYCANGARVVAGGPCLQLGAKLALALHLVIHELATNASKHGALTSKRGTIDVRWNIEHVPGPARKLTIVWTEHGGPEVKEPRQRGGRHSPHYDGARLSWRRAVEVRTRRCGLPDADRSQPRFA